MIGMDVAASLERFRTQRPHRFQVAEGPVRLCGVLLDVDESTGRARRIERISRIA